ncbi:hypothetical protein [Streptomyces fulvoviolaceus]|uniref:hypothetical protein n=1 Tax=Streptomyces fulvoviolaceus TaxID=285535 RepID=UPI0004CA0220|nr:hypothetical protein [Streptomyces fulvoviolaceus]
MRTYIGRQQAISAEDFAELALGTPVELWLGVEGESEQERAAREDAARDILADNPNFPDDLVRIAAQVIEDNPDLFDVVPLVRPTRRRTARKGVAA